MLNGFWMQRGQFQREQTKAMVGARMRGLSCGWGAACNEKIRSTRVPVGDVEFCQEFLGWRVTPDFYPEFLRDHLHRQIFTVQWDSTIALPAGHTWFVKSAETYKAFSPFGLEGGIAGAHPELNGHVMHISEYVWFVQEWRYYVSNGSVVATGWYDGLDDDEPAPDPYIQWPADFCGAVDFGRLNNGALALVECHHPFACGWYGDDPEAWVLWLLTGWEYLKRTTNPAGK